MKHKEWLAKEVWSKESYYQQSHQGSFDLAHPGMKILRELTSKAKNILDLGCGEGTRLNLVTNKKQSGCGIDLSDKAIKIARERYPDLKFYQGDLETLPFESESFDLLYAAFVLEHLDNPTKVLLEARRVLRQGGYLVLISPNYGSPNRVSPVRNTSRLLKLIRGLLEDILLYVVRLRSLGWRQVTPLANKKIYISDWDTVVEPYIGSLTNYLEYNG